MPIRGDAARRQLDNLRKNVPGEFATALYQEALVVEGVSRRRTPVMTGALRNSHVTSQPAQVGKKIGVLIQVGGPAVGYAVYVHENLEAYHKVGQAKFLESAVREAIPKLPGRLVRRVNLNRAAR